jgi:CheY-like chemotaxis protein
MRSFCVQRFARGRRFYRRPQSILTVLERSDLDQGIPGGRYGGGAAGGAASHVVMESFQPVEKNSIGTLSGKRILIVEDEFYIALDLSRALSAAGAHVVGPFPDCADALQALERKKVDAAVLDVKLQAGTACAVAKELKRRHIPFLLATGYERYMLPPQFLDAPHLLKPFGERHLVEAMEQVLERRWTPN